MSKRLLALLAAVAAIALIAAGCGGGSDNTGSASSLSKAEFVKKGNAICARGQKEIDEGVENFGKEHNLSGKVPTKAERNELTNDVLIPIVLKEVDNIRALGIPSGNEKEVEAMLSAVEEATVEIEKDPSLLNPAGAGPFKKPNKLAREYGLNACGEE